MKATGIVRRIDDLGRVVIPKEIRRTLRIREGDPLEIFTEKDGEVIFKKYSPMGELAAFAGELCEAMHRTSGSIAAVCDRDSIIALSGGGRKELYEKNISPELADIMENRRAYRAEPGKKGVEAVSGEENYPLGVAAPILAEGDVLGSVLLIARAGTNIGETELKLAQTAAVFLGKQMES